MVWQAGLLSGLPNGLEKYTVRIRRTLRRVAVGRCTGVTSQVQYSAAAGDTGGYMAGEISGDSIYILVT